MTNQQRFEALLSGNGSLDRTPVIEWASWWDKTLAAWKEQGLSFDETRQLNAYWGHDDIKQFWLPIRSEGCPTAPPASGNAIMNTPEDYKALKKYLYQASTLDQIYTQIKSFRDAHESEDIVYWFSLDGFFWFPRTLFGIEGHLYAFYDYPELMLEINRDLCEYHKRCLEVLYSLIKPAFMTFGEDMSYNHGPMLSKEQFDTYCVPFYKELVPTMKAHGTRVLIDTDGFVEPLIPWFLAGGIEGILPLERMAGVDVNRIRENYPELIMIGGYDKTVMHKGEAAMRAEFERILPAIRSGRYIPSVDHQTPPDVTIENYEIFMMLLREYSSYGGRA